MGFNLKMFFQDLERALHTGSMWTRLSRLKKVIEDGKKYAEDCGHI